MRTEVRPASESTSSMRVDDHRHGFNTSSPLILLVTLVVFGWAWYAFSQLQIISTEQAVFGLLQIGVRLSPGITAQQAVEFMNGNMDREHTIANAIGWAVQLYMFMVAFPGDRAFLSVHKKYNSQNSESIAKNADTMAKIKHFIMIVLIGGDIVTDFLYVASGHSLISGFNFGFIPNISGSSASILLVGLLYPTAVCGVTIFCGVEAAHRLDALFDKLRGK